MSALKALPTIVDMVARVERHLCVIFAADVAEYSRLMRSDEEGTLAQLIAARKTMDDLISLNRGRIVNSVGDSVLAEFSSVMDAMRAAIDIQRDVDAAAAATDPGQRVLFRIGLQLGEVMVRSTDIYGDGVNVAARLQSLAEPGGIVVSGTIHEQLRDRLSIRFVDLGEQTVKNIDRPVPAFGVTPDVIAAAPRSAAVVGTFRWKSKLAPYATVAMGVLVLTGAVWLTLRASKLGEQPASAAQTRATENPKGALQAMSLAIAPLTAPPADTAAVNFADSLRRDLSTGVSAIARDVTLMALAADAAGSSPSGGARSLALSAGARYVVEGDVRSGDTDKIVNLRLVDTESGIQAWSGQYTFHETDGSVESSIAKRKVMGRLVGAVWVAESKRVLSLPIDRLTPAELVVRGWAMYGQSETLATAAEARRLFDAALAADPNNVMALKARAQVLNEFLNLDPNIGLEQLAREMDHYSNRAMNLDPWGPEVWELRAVSLRYQRRWNAAIEALDQAIKRDPFSPAYYTEKANNVIMLGAPEDALRLLDRALAMNPSNPWWEFMNQCYAHLLLGQPDRAIQACEKSIGYYDFWATHSFLVAAFANKGDMERAADAARALQKGAPGYTIARARRYSEVPEFVALAEKYWFTGMRKAGVPEK